MDRNGWLPERCTLNAAVFELLHVQLLQVERQAVCVLEEVGHTNTKRDNVAAPTAQGRNLSLIHI